MQRHYVEYYGNLNENPPLCVYIDIYVYMVDHLVSVEW